MLKINQISFNNWRSFTNPEPIVFSTDPNKNVTLIRGDNESGKTSIFKGILWAFYGSKTEHMKKKYKDHLDRMNKQSVKEGAQSYSVEIHIENENKKFVITREAKLIKGKKYDNRNFSESLAVTSGGSVFEDDDAQEIINTFFENQISRFYLFDGEMLNEYERLVDGSESDLANKIKSSIEDILRVTDIKNAKQSLDVVKGDSLNTFNSDQSIDAKAKNITSDIEKLNEEIDDYDASIEEIKKEIIDLEDEVDEFEKKLNSKANEIDLIDTRNQLHEEIIGYKEEISGLETTLKESLHGVQNDFFTKITDGLLKIKIAEKDSLSQQKSELTEHKVYKKLLKNNSISDDSKKIIMSLSGDNKDADLESLEDEIYYVETDIKVLSDDLHKSNRDKIILTSSELKSARAKMVLAQSKLKQTNEELENHKNLTEEEIETLDGLPNQIKTHDRKIVRKSMQLKEDEEGSIGYKRKMAVDKRKLLEAMPTVQTNSLSQITYNISKELFDIFQTAVDQLSAESKSYVQKAANKIYKDLREGRHNSKLALKINDNFGLELYTDDGDGEILATSAGGSQIVALSLIMALRQTIGIDAPLIMDTPFARLDLKYRSRILELMPSLGHQFVLFVQPGEIEKHSTLDKKLRSKLGAAYEIEQIEDLRSEIKDVKV